MQITPEEAKRYQEWHKQNCDYCGVSCIPKTTNENEKYVIIPENGKVIEEHTHWVTPPQLPTKEEKIEMSFVRCPECKQEAPILDGTYTLIHDKKCRKCGANEWADIRCSKPDERYGYAHDDSPQPQDNENEKCGICEHEVPCPHSRLDKVLKSHQLPTKEDWEAKLWELMWLKNKYREDSFPWLKSFIQEVEKKAEKRVIDKLKTIIENTDEYTFKHPDSFGMNGKTLSLVEKSEILEELSKLENDTK